jgi:hypothetical protein
VDVAAMRKWATNKLELISFLVYEKQVTLISEFIASQGHYKAKCILKTPVI